MSVVPRIRSFQGGTALGDLFRRSVRLATIVQATSRRRDVRELRAQLLGLLLSLRCPVGGNPAKAWYVRGAAARLGIEGLARAWRGFWGEDPPTVRTLRSHMGVLERCGALVRAPGDWLPTAAGAPRLRWPDTFHVLEDERDARWWVEEGLPVLARRPEARIDPSAWRKLFRTWRDRARDPQGRLPFPGSRLRPDEDSRPTASGPDDARVLRAALAASNDSLDLLAALRTVGAAPDGRVLFQVAGQDGALRRAAERLAGELARRIRIRNRPGWLVWAFRDAGGKLAGAWSAGRAGA